MSTPRVLVVIAPLMLAGAPSCVSGPDLIEPVTSQPPQPGTTTGETEAESTGPTTALEDMAMGTGGSMTAGASTTGPGATGETSDESSGEPVCGNGAVEGDEACDDGNKDNTDECLNSCETPYCGDGILREDKGEECDDGNTDDSDGCNSQCGRDRVVFITSTLYGGSVGGVSGANSQCKQRAQEAGLANVATFRAWLSDDLHSPSEKFVKSKGRYLLTDGTVVADDWADLTDGTIQNPILIDEHGVNVLGGGVWTSTTPTGHRHPDLLDCEGWSTPEFPLKGRIGYAVATDVEWTDAENNPTLCAADGHFYCFEN